MDQNKKRKRYSTHQEVIEERDWGVYVWQMPNGQYMADADGNVLSIAARKYDVDKIGRLKQAAAYYGDREGKPIFIEGARKISHAEWEDQKERMLLGLVGDPYDEGVKEQGIAEYKRKYTNEGKL